MQSSVFFFSSIIVTYKLNVSHTPQTELNSRQTCQPAFNWRSCSSSSLSEAPLACCIWYISCPNKLNIRLCRGSVFKMKKVNERRACLFSCQLTVVVFGRKGKKSTGFLQWHKSLRILNRCIFFFFFCLFVLFFVSFFFSRRLPFYRSS